MEAKTVFVDNLPASAIKSDVKTHFCEALKVERVEVSDLVPYIRSEEEVEEKKVEAQFAYGTTVTFPKVAKWKETLRGKYFRPGNGPLKVRPKFEIAIQEQFLGLTGLRQHDKDLSVDYSHEFEYVHTLIVSEHFVYPNRFVFVHGLDEHPFYTWARHKEFSSIDLTMWPRDFLPRSLKKRNLHGRYSTFGYPIEPSDWVSINEGAEYLLAEIQNHRVPVCTHQTSSDPSLPGGHLEFDNVLLIYSTGRQSSHLFRLS